MNKRILLFPMIAAVLTAAVVVSTLVWSSLAPGGLRLDEEVVFFPTSGARDKEGGWQLPVHAWIFEREEEDLTRILGRRLLGELAGSFGITKRETDSPLFKQRIKYFLVDNQRNKRLELSISSLEQAVPTSATLNKSTANGHSQTVLPYTRADPVGSWLTYSVKLPKSDQRNFIGQIKLIPPVGLSVICDIDDTIKVSNVLNKPELLRNSLFRPYKPVRSMSGHLRELEQKGAYFHYVSASPWQLFPALKQFLDNHVPRGSVTLRNFRLKDRSFMDFLGSSKDYKIKRITAILKRYPGHSFILIGDAGEHDPEIYGTIYRSFPAQIAAITIRAIEGSELSQQRFAEAFRGVPRDKWKVRIFAQ